MKIYSKEGIYMKRLVNENHHYDEMCGCRLYEYVETNTYMNILYKKPLRSYYKKGIFGYIKYKYKERKYYKNNILPLYTELYNTSPDFNTMYMYADFIRLLERVFFYNNAYSKDTTVKIDKLMSDNDVTNPVKVLILDLEEDNVTITFKIYKQNEQEIIETKVNYNFGKKSCMNYKIVDRDVIYDSIHSENLMITILERLQHAMGKLFLEYYLKL